MMDFCRGSKDDYDRWANVTGSDMWAWDNIYPYALKVDRMTLPADHHDPVGQFDPHVHDHGERSLGARYQHTDLS